MSFQPSSAPMPGDRSFQLVSLHHTSATGPIQMVISGEMDSVNADRLRRAVIDALRDLRPRQIKLDLEGVTFLDSAGIRALLMCKSDAERADSKIRLTRISDRVYQVLAITGLCDHFELTTEPQFRSELGE